MNIKGRVSFKKRTPLSDLKAVFKKKIIIN